MWVSPFRHLRLIGYLLLPEAFRSLSRLSSALSAKASTLRSLLLGHSDLIALTSDGWCCLVCLFLHRCISTAPRFVSILRFTYFRCFVYAVFKVHKDASIFKNLKSSFSHLAVLSAIQTQKFFMLESLVKSPFTYFIFCNPAATCSPTPSPVQYHRPLRS